MSTNSSSTNSSIDRHFCRSLWIAWALTVIGMSGCGALTTRPAPAKLGDEAARSAPDPKSHCTMVFHGRNGSQRTSVPLEGPIQISKLLEQNDGHRFRKSEVVIFRELPGATSPVRMDVRMAGRRQVKEEFNYAVHPGDRVLVKEDTTTVLDKALKLLGPVGR